MIPLEAVLALLDELRAEAIGLIETPRARDAFEFGSTHGMISAVAEMRERLQALVENSNRNHEDDR